jgi:transposase InsO family protein
MERLLSKIYYDASNPGGYASADALWLACGKRISKSKVKKWLQSQDTYTLHKQRQMKIKRQRYYVTNIGDLYQGDLCDLRNLAAENDNMKYIITVIDTFSKNAWALPIRTKSSTDMIKAFEIIFKDRKPIKFQSDKGCEFLAKPVQTYFKKLGIIFFTSNQPAVKASICERFNRTLRTRM